MSDTIPSDDDDDRVLLLVLLLLKKMEVVAYYQITYMGDAGSLVSRQRVFLLDANSKIKNSYNIQQTLTKALFLIIQLHLLL